VTRPVIAPAKAVLRGGFGEPIWCFDDERDVLVRFRHVGFLGNGVRVAAIAKARTLLNAPAPETPAADASAVDPAASPPCPACGGRMMVVERFERGGAPRAMPLAAFRIDTS